MNRLILFLLLSFSTLLQAQISKDMDLLSNWSTGNTPFNDIWAYVDSNGKEYAIIGSRSHYYFVNVTNGSNPQMINGFPGGSTTVWRDMKTYSQWAYGVCDNCNEGLAIFFMGDDPSQNGVTLLGQNTDFFTRAHNIFVDEEHGRLYVIGSNTQGNGVIILDIKTNPAQPTLLTASSLPGGYIHDMYVRNHIGYANSGNSGLYIYDFSNVNQIRNLGNLTSYQQQGYNHSSWLDPAGKYLVMADETHNTSIKLCDVSDPTDIEVESLFRSELLAPAVTGSIAHNPFIRDNYAIISYYHDGVQIFDLSNPSNPTQVAWYDTYPNNSGYGGYSGCWGTYPFLPSGKILGSDGATGLYVLNPTEITFTPPPSVFPPFANLNLAGPICLEEGESVMLSVDTDAHTFQWYKDNQQVGFEKDYEVTSSGTYICKVYKGPHSATRIVEVNIGTPPDASLNLSGSYEICEGDDLIIEAAAGADSYQWLYNGLYQQVFTASYEADQIGSYQVLVSNGVCETLSEEILVTAVIPAADLSLNLTETQQLCQGESVTLEVPEGAESYQWYSNGMAIDGANENVYEASTTGNFYVEGGLGECLTSSDGVVVQVIGNPDATLNFSGNDNEICEDDSYTLIAPIGAENYNWYFNGELVQTGEENIFNANQEGTYYLEASNLECVSTSDEFGLLVNETPDVTIAQEEFNAICAGEEFTLTVVGEAENYAWYYNGDILPGENGTSVTTDQAGTYEVIANNGDCFGFAPLVNLAIFEIPEASLNVSTYNEICEGDELEIVLESTIGIIEWLKDGEAFAGAVTSIEASESGSYQAIITNGPCSTSTELIEVNVLEQLEATLAGPEYIELCEGENYTLNSNAGGNQLTWYRDGIALEETSSSINVSIAGVYYAEVGEGNCAGITGNVEVVFNPAPDVSLDGPSAIDLCKGDSYEITAALGADSYTWYKDGISLGEDENVLLITESGTYYFEAAANACTATSESVLVNFTDNPNIDLQTEELVNICEGENFVIEPIVSADSYLWFRNGEEFASTYSINIVESGTYYLVASKESCESTSESVIVNVNPIPSAEILGADEILLCEGEETILMLEGNEGTYQWFFNGNPISSSNSIVADQSGEYYVQVESNGCIASSETVSVNVLADIELNLNYTGTVNICEGENIILETTDGADTYLWSLNGNTIDNTGSELIITEAGEYMVEAFIGECSSVSESISVELSTFPSTELSVNGSTSMGNDISLCEGGDHIISVPEGAGEYEWYLNGEAIPDTDTNTLTVSTDGTYQVSASNQDCASFSEEISIDLIAIPEVSILTETQSFCEGESIELTLLGTAETIGWYLNGTLISMETSINLDEGGEIRVMALNGECRTETEVLVIEEIALPEVSISESGSLTLCEGESYELFAESNTDKITWYRDGNVLTNESSSLMINEAGTYYVEASNEGCIYLSQELTVSFDALPVAELTIDGEAVICQGESVQIRTGSADSYVWYFNGDVLDVEGNLIEATMTGSYQVELNINGCYSESEIFVLTVNEAPEIILENELNYELCEGDDVTLSTLTSSDEYVWFYNNEQIENASDASIEVNEAGTYYLVASNAGCASTSQEVIVNVIGVPEITFENNTGLITFCEDEEKVLQIIGEAESYTWSYNGAEIGNGQSLTITEGGVYQAVASNGNCTSETIEISVNITETPDAGLEFPDGTSFCNGDFAMVEAVTGYEFYFWMLDGEATGTNNSNLQVFEGGTYTLTVVNNDCSAEATFEIEVIELPEVNIQSPAFEFCPGDFIDLSANIENAEQYVWYRDGEIIQGANGSTLSVSEPGAYELSISVNGCENTSSDIVISHYFVEQATFQVDGGVLTASEGATFQWYLNGVAIEDATANSFTATETGLYQVEIIDDNGCLSLSDEVQVTITSLNELEGIVSLSIFPNPTSDVLNVALKSTQSRVLHLSLMGKLGENIFEKQIDRSSEFNEQVEMNDLSAGIYFLEIKDELGNKIVKKIIKIN